MIKTIATLFASAALSFGAMAGDLPDSAVGKQVQVEVVEKNVVTQVVAFDGINTYLMATGQKVDNLVTVTPEMAGNAVPFRLAKDVLPNIYSSEQASNTGLSDGAFTSFAKMGKVEPLFTQETVVSKVYFFYDNQVYTFETTDEVGEHVNLTDKLVAMSVKATG